jgi:hypothetical protein
MPRINVSRVISNPAFAKGYTVFRKTGEWVSGRWVPSETQINVKNVVTAPSSKDLVQIPEADRTTGVMCFHSAQELFITRDSGTSDEIVWNNTRYRIFKVVPWSDYGYWKAFGVGI